MLELIIIGISAFGASLLTFYSGFGLGTILTAVLAVFFDLPVAIALTAIVHLSNNVFKLTLTYKNAIKDIVLRFGIPALLAAIVGAYLLKLFNHTKPLYQYFLYERQCEITWIKLLVGLIMMGMTLLEWRPILKIKTSDRVYLTLGGVLSGFFGGLSGHQGALRSLFLVNQKMSKEAFIATGVAIACLIDVCRIPMYLNTIDISLLKQNFTTILVATVLAFAGAYLGSKWIKKITIEKIQYLVAVMVMLISLLLITGIL